jgi:hypothetical protein
MSRWAARALLLGAFVLPAQAGPPPLGEPRDFRLPDKETLQLANGLALTFIDYGTVPKVTVLAVVRTGKIDEGQSTWLADRPEPDGDRQRDRRRRCCRGLQGW